MIAYIKFHGLRLLQTINDKIENLWWDDCFYNEEDADHFKIKNWLEDEFFSIHHFQNEFGDISTKFKAVKFSFGKDNYGDFVRVFFIEK